MKEFNNSELAALVSLLVEMANVDNKVAIEEIVEFQRIVDEYHIPMDVVEAGKQLSYDYAISVVKGMSEVKKVLVAKLVVSIMDADLKQEDVEFALLKDICIKTGIDKIVNCEDNGPSIKEKIKGGQ